MYRTVVTICTTRFNIQQYYVQPTQCIYVLCGSQNKQQLFPYTTLTDWFFVTERKCVYCALRTGFLYITEEPFLLGCDAISLCNRPLKMKAFPSKGRKLVTSVIVSRNNTVSTTPSYDSLSDWHHNRTAVSAPNTPRLCITQTALQSIPVSDSLQNKPSQLTADHLPPSSAEVNNAWSHTSTPPYACMR